MKENDLTPENYYNDYQGWDLRLMYERFKKLGLPEELREKIKEKGKASFLVLGSATPDNLSQIAKIDHFLRPGMAVDDDVFVIDQNMYPLSKHKEQIDVFEGKSSWSKNGPLSTEEFPLPTFKLVQSDMKALPFSEGSIDFVVSDYTVNFLNNLKDVSKAFYEVARTLSTQGLVMIAVRGNVKYPYNNEESSGIQDDDLQKELLDGTQYYFFPLQTYMHIAKQHGLEILSFDTVGTDIFAILVKK